MRQKFDFVLILGLSATIFCFYSLFSILIYLSHTSDYTINSLRSFVFLNLFFIFGASVIFTILFYFCLKQNLKEVQQKSFIKEQYYLYDITFDKTVIKKIEVNRLKELLTEAIEKEEFEIAALIHKRMKKIKIKC